MLFDGFMQGSGMRRSPFLKDHSVWGLQTGLRKANLALGRPTRRLQQQPRCRLRVAWITVVVREV